MGMTSLLTGLVGFVLAFIPGFNYAAGFCVLIAVFGGFIALVKSGDQWGWASIAVGILLVPVWVIVALSIGQNHNEDLQAQAAATPAPLTAVETATVTIQARSSTPDARLTIRGIPGLEGATLPVDTSITIPTGGDNPPFDPYLEVESAYAPAADGENMSSAYCHITVNGSMKAQENKTGHFAIALCTIDQG